MYRDLPCFEAPPAPSRGRALATLLLRAASAGLERIALRLARADLRPAPGEPIIEFHAEAGAPEGALYVDGHLVGHVVGVNRL
jgi:hypothetical protein